MSEEPLDIRVLDTHTELNLRIKAAPTGNVLVYRIERGNEPLEIYLAPAVRAELLAHARQEPRREVGGVLVGGCYRFSETDNRVYVEIVGSLRAAHTQGSAIHLTFTPDSWSQLHNDLQEYYPGSAIVGWYHTHPGHGVFLSPDDRFVQNHWFAHDYQLALVVDHLRGEAGFFVGAEHTAYGISQSPIYVWDAPAMQRHYTSSSSVPNRVESRPQFRIESSAELNTRSDVQSNGDATWFQPPLRAWQAGVAASTPISDASHRHERLPSGGSSMTPTPIRLRLRNLPDKNMAAGVMMLVSLPGIAGWLITGARVFFNIPHSATYIDHIVFVSLNIVLLLLTWRILSYLRNG